MTFIKEVDPDHPIKNAGNKTELNFCLEASTQPIKAMDNRKVIYQNCQIMVAAEDRK